jgi:serine/threonine protein kinase
MFLKQGDQGMAKEENKNLEQSFSGRVETLRSFYNTDVLEMSDDELASLTPILNSLKGHVERYQKIHEIAEGGEKKVSLVHDQRLDRRVAMARASRANSPQDQEQFLREARLTANLSHPNIMPVYNMGLDAEGVPFFSMELVPGDSLKTIISKLREGDAEYRKEYSLKKLLDIFVKVCEAIAYAHSRNVLHLDIKPDNIRVGAFGEVLVCDWGLARVIHAPEETANADEEVLDGDMLNDMTLSGTMKGTPGFMAPEQTLADGEKTAQTDVYALGALLYMMLTHELPVRGDSANEVIQNTRAGKVVPPRRRKPEHPIPKSLVAVAMNALALEPAERYESVLALREDINRFLTGYPTYAEHAGLLTTASLLLQRHSRLASLIIVFLLLLAGVISANLVAISREKAQAITAREEAVLAREEAEGNFRLYLKEQQLAKELGSGLSEAVQYTVRSRDYVNAASMIQVLETGLKENIDAVRRKNLLAQKGILHFVLQEFNAANESFHAAGSSRRIDRLRILCSKYAQIKPVDQQRLSDRQLAELFVEANEANQMTLFYLYYHHIRRRPASALPEDYTPLAGAVLDRLNYSKWAKKNPLALSKTEQGYHLDLSESSYLLLSINITGIYRRNVLAPFRLSSLDISHSRLSDLNELRGLRLDELRMEGVELEYPRILHKQIASLQLKRIVLNVSDFPPETIAELRTSMEVVDAAEAAATPIRRADAGSPESAAP